MTTYAEKIKQLTISPVKRERMRKEEKERIRKELRASLPKLTKDEIRRHRLPYHEALISELETTGRPSAADYLRQLFAYQEAMRQEHGPDTVVWNRPELLKSKTQLDALFQGLSRAEECNYNNDIGGECDEMIKLAVTFAFSSEDWGWLGEQLLIQCIAISASFEADGNKRQAISRYIYGKFFLENLNDPISAQEHLNVARELSQGMPWTASKELNKKDEDTVFISSCILLYKALMAEAEIAMKYDFQKAIKCSVTARKRAAEACYHEGETNALLFKGKCERLLNDTAAAIESFQKALIVQLHHVSPEGICEARVQLALAYIRHGDTVLALQQLQILMDYATENGLHFYIAQAYRYLGMYHITNGVPSEATPLLIKALELFHEQGRLVEMEQVRNFAAISAAQELLPMYTKLIVHCDKRGVVDMKIMTKLIRWKDLREFFWSEGDASLHSVQSVTGSGMISGVLSQSLAFRDETADATEGETKEESDIIEGFVNVEKPEPSALGLLLEELKEDEDIKQDEDVKEGEEMKGGEDINEDESIREDKGIRDDDNIEEDQRVKEDEELKEEEIKVDEKMEIE